MRESTTTHTRESSLPPTCGWAEAHAWLHDGGSIANTQGSNRETEEATGDTGKESPLKGTRLSGKFSTRALNGVHIASTGVFPQLNEIDESKLGPAYYNFYRGKNFLKRLVISHGGRFHNSITNVTHFLLIGDLLVKVLVEKAVSKGVHRVNYKTIQNIIYGRLSISEAFNIPSPETPAAAQILGPPSHPTGAGDAKQ